jgi:dTMP kinase
MKKGLFITFEGLDASGKSTQIGLLDTFLRERGCDALLTREPGGTGVGERIRQIILDNASAEMDSVTETMLYAAARAQLVAQVIRPALESGRTVICDRFVDSSIAYQGFGRKLGEAVEIINAYAVRDCAPDVTFFLKTPPEVGAARRRQRENDRMENEGADYHEAVYAGYLALERRYPERVVGVDGRGSAAQIARIIRRRIEPFLAAAARG